MAVSLIFIIRLWISKKNFQVPLIFHGEFEIPEVRKEAIRRGYGCVEKFLTDSQYVAGRKLTVADFCVWSILEPSLAFIPVPKKDYPKIFAYIERMRQELPFKDLMINAVDEHMKILNDIIEKNRAAKTH